MHGLPEQSIEAAVEDLRIAIEQSPSHISWYQFTIEPNTYFYNYPPKLPAKIFKIVYLKKEPKF